MSTPYCSYHKKENGTPPEQSAHPGAGLARSADAPTHLRLSIQVLGKSALVTGRVTGVSLHTT